MTGATPGISIENVDTFHTLGYTFTHSVRVKVTGMQGKNVCVCMCTARTQSIYTSHLIHASQVTFI